MTRPKKLTNAQISHELNFLNATSLVQSLQAQSSITSFNPIIQTNIYSPLTLMWTLLTYMYKTHGVIQTAIDMPVLDALRGGVEIHSGEMDTDDIKDIQDELENGGILATLGNAEKWARLYGGAALIINVDQNPESPLQEEALTELEFYAVNRWELITQTGWKPGALQPWFPAGAKINEEFFMFYGRRIHRSRVLFLSGKEAPYVVKWQLGGWGMSEVERMVEDFNSYIRTKEVLYELLREAKMDVYQMEGLKSQLTSDIGAELTRKRIEKMNEMKNFMNAIVLDSKDIYEQKQLTFTGIAEVMKQNMIGVASALRMPMTKLFGLSASGFNSGEDDIENYNAMVESEVREKLRRPIRKILQLVCLKLFGDKMDLSFEFKPLRVLGAVEEEAIKTSKQTRALELYDRSLLDSREVGEVLEKDKLISIETEAARGLLEEHPESAMMGGGEDDGDDEGKKKKDKNKGGQK